MPATTHQPPPTRPRIIRNLQLVTDDGEVIPVGPQHPDGIELSMNQAALDIYLARTRRLESVERS